MLSCCVISTRPAVGRFISYFIYAGLHCVREHIQTCTAPGWVRLCRQNSKHLMGLVVTDVLTWFWWIVVVQSTGKLKTWVLILSVMGLGKQTHFSKGSVKYWWSSSEELLSARDEEVDAPLRLLSHRRCKQRRRLQQKVFRTASAVLPPPWFVYSSCTSTFF